MILAVFKSKILFWYFFNTVFNSDISLSLAEFSITAKKSSFFKNLWEENFFSIILPEFWAIISIGGFSAVTFASPIIISGDLMMDNKKNGFYIVYNG